MSDKDYSEILDGSVEEVKDNIRDEEDLDLHELRDAEEEGENRKTVKEFIDDRLEEEVDETIEEVKKEESTDIVFGAGGAVAGLVVGLLIGFLAFGATGEVSPDQVQQDLEEYWEMELENIDFEGDYTVSEPEMRHGMYYTVIDINGTLEGEPIEESQGFYITEDGELLFTELVQFGQVVEPIQLQEVLQDSEDEETTEDEENGETTDDEEAGEGEEDTEENEEGTEDGSEEDSEEDETGEEQDEEGEY